MRDRAIVRLLGDVGLRPSEVCALQLGDILWSAAGRAPDQLRVAWGEGRVVRLTQQATAALVDWLARHPGWQPETRRWALPAKMLLFLALGQPKTAGKAITEDGLLRQVLRHASRPESRRICAIPLGCGTSGRPSRSPAGSRRPSCRLAAAGETAAARRRTSNGPPLRPPWRWRLT